jgi:hypothetical protein
MTGRRDSFSKIDVSVTLTGEEWFTILARINCLLKGMTRLESADTLSAKGAKVYNRAMGKLQEQLLAASAASCASLQQEGGEQ